MAIEFKKPITFTKDSTIYGHNAVDEGGFPTEPGNGKLSQVLDMAEDQTMSSLKAGITFIVDSSDSLLYHFCIDGTSVATFSVPPDKFLKSVSYDEDTRELVFTFTSGSTESSVRVNMSSLVDVYTAGNGLSLSSGVFSIKIKSTETRLKVDLDGLYIDMSDIISKIETETSQRQATYTDLDSRITALNLTFTNMTDEIASDMAAAKSAKEDAEKAATLAQGYQTTAAEKATSASNSALRAANSATEASDSAALAKDWAVKTSGKVDDTDSSAKTYAIASKNYFTKAETSATEAANSATEAANSATNAKQSEDNAKASAEQAEEFLSKYTETSTPGLITEVERTRISSLVGCIMWYAIEDKPKRTLVCNGATIPRTGEYAELFAVLGTKYGSGDGSTTFGIPNLITQSRFIRAGEGDSVGTTQEDAIRNITGTLKSLMNGGSNTGTGALSMSSKYGNPWKTGSGNDEVTITFDASKDVPTASENRPYNIALLPIIFY